MANQKLSNLVSLTAPHQEDLLLVVDDPGGTPLSRKSPVRRVQAAMGAGAKAYAVTNQQVNHATWTRVNFPLEVWDDAAFHSTVTNNSRFTIPAGYGGRYLLIAQTLWATPNDGQRYWTNIKKNDAYIDSAVGINIGGTVYCEQAVYIVDAVATNYFEIFVYQNSSTTEYLDESYFTIQKIG